MQLVAVYIILPYSNALKAPFTYSPLSFKIGLLFYTKRTGLANYCSKPNKAHHNSRIS